MYVYILYVYTYIYIYIYRDRERARVAVLALMALLVGKCSTKNKKEQNDATVIALVYNGHTTASNETDNVRSTRNNPSEAREIFNRPSAFWLRDDPVSSAEG